MCLVVVPLGGLQSLPEIIFPLKASVFSLFHGSMWVVWWARWEGTERSPLSPVRLPPSRGGRRRGGTLSLRHRSLSRKGCLLELTASVFICRWITSGERSSAAKWIWLQRWSFVVPGRFCLPHSETSCCLFRCSQWRAGFCITTGRLGITHLTTATGPFNPTIVNWAHQTLVETL